MILRARRNTLEKKPNPKTKSTAMAPKNNPKQNNHNKKKKNVIETPAMSDPPVPKDVIDVLIGRFFTERYDPTPNKESPVVGQEESNDKACSTKGKREKPEGKGVGDREKDKSKRLKKGKKTDAGKNIRVTVGNSDSPSQPKQRAEDGLFRASIQEEPEILTTNFGEQFLSARDDPTSRKENPVVEQEELRDKECSSKRKREKPEAKGTEEREKDESKRLKKGKKTTAGKNICRSDANFDSPSRLKQRAANGLLAASIEEEPETVTVNFREHNCRGCGQASNTRPVVSSSGKSRKARGLAYFTEDTGGVREVIVYNTEGQPIGPVAKKFITYLGVLGRRMVPIIYESWFKVPKELKGTLLNNVEARYVVDSKRRKNVLSSIGRKWVTFKSYLTTVFILPFKDHPELLGSPPEQYKFIEQDHWDVFVKSRLSEEFQNRSKCHSAIRAMNKYNHRVGSKGYAGLAEELKQSLGASADEIDRCDLWKKARQDKNGAYLDDAVREKAELIDELIKQKEEGKLVIEGDKDILTLALGTPENSHRVRGVGSFITPKSYFRLPRRNSKKHISELQQKVNQQADKILEMNQMVKELQAQPGRISQQRSPARPSSEKISRGTGNCGSGKHLTPTSVESTSQNESGHSNDDHPYIGCETDFESNGFLDTRFDMSSPDFNSTTGKGGSCNLAVDSKTNIVARGIVSEVKPNEKIHNIPLGESYLRVAVEHVIAPNALLPVPVVGEMTMVKDAIGSFVAWPKELVLSGVEEMENQAAGEESGPIQAFASFVDQMVLADYITVPMQSAIFEADFEAHLHKDHLLLMCNMQEISDSCIITYIGYLYEKLISAQGRYGFVNPASINSAKGPHASSMVTKKLQIAKRDQLVFVPYKMKGHWVLIVIDSSSMDVYWLDPLQKPLPMDIKIYVTMGLKALQTDGKKRPHPIWHCVKCPKLSLDVQCGYHVMRYMKELLEESAKPFAEKILQLGQKETYSQDEIDEVRLEFIDFTLAHM